MLKLLGRSVRDFRASYPKLLIFEYLFMLATSAVLVPAVTYIFNQVLGVIGSGSLINGELYRLGLSWESVLGLLAIGLVVSFAIFIELCVLVIIIQQHYFGKEVAIADALLTTLRRTPRLLSFGAVQLFVLLSVLIPFVDSPLSRSFFALFNVPILLQNKVLNIPVATAAVYVLILLGAIYLVLRWIFVLHYIVLEGKTIGAAVRSSQTLTRGHRLKLLAALLLLNAAVVGAGFAAISSLSYLPSWLNRNMLKAFTDHYSLTLSAVLTYLFTLMIMPANLILLTRLFYLFESRRGIRPRDRLRLYRSALGRLEQRFANALRRYPRKRLLHASVAVVYVALALFVGFRANDNLVYAKWSVVVSAHRGDTENAPENSLAAVRGAIEKGLHAVELDVQLTKDGVAVLNHDATLYRMAGTTDRVSDLTFAEIGRLSIGQDAEGEPLPIPTLGEVLDEAKGRIRLLLDLKPYGSGKALAQEVVRLVQAYDMEKDVYIQSFDGDSLRQVRALAPDIRIGQIMYFALGNLSTLDVDFYTVEQVMATESFVGRAHKAGREVWVWTVNGKRNLKEVMKLRVDGIITDTPVLAQSMVEIDL